MTSKRKHNGIRRVTSLFMAVLMSLLCVQSFLVAVAETAEINGYTIGEPMERNTQGYYVLTNEPLHEIKIKKTDALTGVFLEGAEFQLSWTESDGTAGERTETTDEFGTIVFDGLKSGTYVLKETTAPEHYALDETEHVIVVDTSGYSTCYTLDFMTLQDYSDYYEIKNERKLEGTIEIVKHWEDDTEADREAPIVHLDTDMPYQKNLKATISKSLFSNISWKADAETFTRTKSIPADADTIKVDDGETDCSVYCWIEGTNAYWWSDAEIVYLPGMDYIQTYGDSQAMFNRWSSLKTIDLRAFNTSKVNSLNSMFKDCTSLTSVNLTGVDTSNVEDMNYMFSGCTSLTSVNMTGIDTSSVKYMREMFESCSSLTAINLESFDTSSVTDMQGMFKNCSNIKTLDISMFDTINVTNMYQMFYGCSKLETIYVSDRWTTTNVTTSDQMFGNYYYGGACNNLVGGNGTKCNISYIYTTQRSDKTYARIDNPPKEPGFLTYKEASHTAENPTVSKTRLQSALAGATTLAKNTTATKENLPENAVRIDDDTSDKKIWLWKEGTDAYWWSDAETVYFPKNASSMFDNCTSLTSLDLSGFDTSKTTNMDSMFNNCYGLTSLDVSNIDTSNVTNMSYMFNYCSNLTSLDLSGFDTSNVKNMEGMFSNCKKLTSLDLSGFDTSKVTNMSNMFNMTYYDGLLTSINLSSFDTSNVKSMDYMFQGCRSLTTLDLTNFDTSKVTDMSYMFGFCTGLTTLDLTSFDTSNVTNMRYMFFYDNKLKTVYASSKWDTSKVTSSGSMFTGATSIQGGNGTTFSADNPVDKTYARIDAPNEPGYLTDKNAEQLTGNEPTISKAKLRNALGNGATFTRNTTATKDTLPSNAYRIDDETTESEIWLWHEGTDAYWWSDAVIVYMPEDSSEMFKGCSKLTSLDLSGFNTSKVTDMSYMFNCNESYTSSLESLNISGFDTSNVTNMDSMFRGCNKLTSLDVSNFDTSKVTDMNSMFGSCWGLTSLNVRNIDTSNVTNMSNMFYGCGKLTSLDVSNFNTSNVTNMGGMFRDCIGITSLDLTNFDTSNVTDMSSMFGAYEGGSKIATLDLSSFDTSKVTDMHAMFQGCDLLTTLDISSFDTSNVTRMYEMFNRCYNLTTIYASEKWSTDNATGTFQGMFTGATKLKGGKGTTYSASNPYTYARIDNPPDEPGYFTYKAAPTSGAIPQQNKTTAKAGGEKKQEQARKPGIIEAIINFLVPSACAEEAGDTESEETENLIYSQVSTQDICDTTGMTIEQMAEVYDQWVKNLDGTWSYRFRVFDQDATYYVWESSIEGYQSDTGLEGYYTLMYVPGADNTVDITNTKKQETTTGTLEVTKEVVSSNPDNTAFDITVVFSDTSLNGIYGDVIIAKGVANLSLANGQSRRISEIPAGTTWTVSERNVGYYKASYENKTGTITAGQKQTAKVRNVESHPPIKPEGMDGTLTIKKVWVGDDPSNRKIPIIHVDTTEPYEIKTATIDKGIWNKYVNYPSYYTITGTDEDGFEFYPSVMRDIADAQQNKYGRIYSFERSLIDPRTINVYYGPIRIDDRTTDCKIYFYLDPDNHKAYWWSDATYVYLPENCQSMFAYCNTLETIDLTGMNSSKTKYTSSMFASTSSLKTIYVDKGWTTANMEPGYNQNVFGSGYMDPTNLKGGSGTTFSSDHTGLDYARIDNPPNEPGYFTYKAPLVTGSVQNVEHPVTARYNKADKHTSMLGALTNLILPSANAGDYIAPVEDLVSRSLMYFHEDGESTDDIYSMWIDNGDNTWTYRFPLPETDQTYYVWEGNMRGYDSDHYIMNFETLEYDAGSTPVITVTNTGTSEDPQDNTTAKMVITKKVEPSDPNASFQIELDLEKADGTKLNGLYGDAYFRNGKATVTISDEQEIVISGLPSGTTGIFEEIGDLSKYDVTYYPNREPFRLNAGSTYNYTITNKEKTSEPQTGSLTISKRIEGMDATIWESTQDEYGNFVFNVQLSDNTITGKYGDIVFTNGKATVALKHGESATATGLPEGTKYTVTERSAANVRENSTFTLVTPETGMQGSIQGNTTKSVTAVNREEHDDTKPSEPGTVRLIKRVNGENIRETYPFLINIQGITPRSEFDIRKSNGDVFGSYTASTTGTVTANIALPADTEVWFELPVDAKYRITETETEYIAAYTLTANNHEDSAQAKNCYYTESKANRDTQRSLYTPLETMQEEAKGAGGNTLSYTFTNSPVTYPVRIEKTDPNGAYVEGAHLQVKQGNTVVDEWNTNEQYLSYLYPGTYTLHEETASAGYQTAEDIEFTVEWDGTYHLKNNVNTLTEITMVDEPISLEILKVDYADSTKRLSGARYQLMDDEGTVIAQWTTNSSIYQAGEVIQPGKTYTLHEYMAPAGYYLPDEDVSFRVSKNGKEITLETGKALAEITGENGTYRITIKNKSGMLMPATGGYVNILYITATILMLAACGWLIYQTRAKARKQQH